MKTEYKHIHFEDVSYLHSGRKTKTFICANNNTDVQLGDVAWSRAWRQYCFEPESQTVFSKSCLLDICDFIKQLIEERKNEMG